MRMTVMASHTASELREAARVIGTLARQHGLEPAMMGSIEVERQESAVAREIVLNDRADYLPAPARAAANVPAHAEAFATAFAAAPMPELHGASADQDTEAFDVQALWSGPGSSEDQEITQPALPEGSDAPFDHERDGGLREAA
jgi:hypothetical protein